MRIVFFQNSNNSVRVTDAFMEALEQDADWTTRAVTTGEPVETVKARYHEQDGRGGLGLRRSRHPVPRHRQPLAHERQHRADQRQQPCSEYMYLDDSACNLASLNLMKFVKDDGELDIEGYKHAAIVHRAGDHRRQRELPDAEDRREQPRLRPIAWATPTSAHCS